jgi:hypothetical protein
MCVQQEGPEKVAMRSSGTARKNSRTRSVFAGLMNRRRGTPVNRKATLNRDVISLPVRHKNLARFLFKNPCRVFTPQNKAILFGMLGNNSLLPFKRFRWMRGIWRQIKEPQNRVQTLRCPRRARISNHKAGGIVQRTFHALLSSHHATQTPGKIGDNYPSRRATSEFWCW